MGLASKGFVISQVNRIDSKYAELITSGTHRQGTWNAATNTPTLSQNSGTNGYWYDVTVEGDWDGRHWRVGDKIIFNSTTNKWDQIPTGVEKDDQPMLIGFLNENSSFPTTRPSGKPLLVGDYLKVDSAAVLPFEIDDGTGIKILFDSYMDEAEWNGTRFQEKSYKAGMTNEIGVKNPSEESLSEEAVYQNQINNEFKEKLRNIGEFVNVGNSFDNVDKNEKYLYYLEEDWEKPDEHDDFLCFTSNQDGSTVGYNVENRESFRGQIMLSYNKNDWENWDGNDITLDKDKMIFIKNDTDKLSENDVTFKFTMSGSIAASGNVMSLLNYDNIKQGCFKFLFDGCTALTTAPDLPATTLYDYCYFNMFSGCTSLIKAPDLPATQLASSCYIGMFNGCTALITAPELPATNLYSRCYVGMFYNCTSLITAPDLPATTLAISCYSQMFQGCTNLNSIKLLYTGNFSYFDYFEYWVEGVSSTGTLYYNGSDTTRGVSAIPNGWAVEQFSQNGGD